MPIRKKERYHALAKDKPCFLRGQRPAGLRGGAVEQVIAAARSIAARCALMAPARRLLASVETLQGRQCQFPLCEAAEIPLSRHRALWPVPLAGASHAWSTKRLEAQQICFSARPS